MKRFVNLRGLTMKVLLLNGSEQNDKTAGLICSILTKELSSNNNTIKLLNLWEKEIAGCLGCFGCWIKTPGVCVIPDEARDIAQAVVQSDLVVNITPITFGGYSYHFKKVLDRLIPIISPFFMKINGEIHHKPRYKYYPKSISIGILAKENREMAEIFKNLVKRNAINMHSFVYKCGIFLHTQPPKKISSEISKLLEEVGV